MNIQEALEAASRSVIDINVPFIESVLAGHTEVNALDKDGLTALQKVAKPKYALLVEALLAQGAAVNIATSEGYTALHLAAYSSNQAVVALLLDRGAAINVITEEKERTPLYMAISAGHQEIAEILLAKGASINMTNKEGRTPLHTAVKVYAINIVTLLLRSGARINVRDSKGYTPLSRATCIRYEVIKVEMLKVLLRYGVYSDLSDNNDEILQGYWHTPLKKKKAYQPFYTTLLLTGVPVPEGILLPAPLQSIQSHIQETVSAWLAPLDLSQETCATLTPKFLRVLPRLRA